MDEKITREELDFVFIHSMFAILCLGVIILPFSENGIKILFLVGTYNVIIPVVGYLKDYSNWINIWLFSFILSLLQIFPDWFLSKELDVLVFPDDTVSKIGTVSVYMAGMWAIGIFLLIYSGMQIGSRYSNLITYSTIVISSLLIFGISEMTLWRLDAWKAQNVSTINHLALYIIIPEIILGLSSYWFFEIIKDKEHWKKFPTAFMVMLLYLGSAVFFLLLDRSNHLVL